MKDQIPCHQTRNSIEDIWGPRTPYSRQWPTRIDENCIEEPERWVQSACVLCSNGCGLDIGVKDGKVVGVRGRADDRVNKGRLGPKGLNGWTSLSHKDRLKYPIIRKNGLLTKSSWDEAMSLIVKKAKDVIERLTAHGIGFYTSGQLFLEDYYALALIGKAGLNTLHMDGNTRLCTATAAASMRESFGSDGQPGSYEDIDYTECMLIVGHNMAATQTVLWSRVLDRLAGPKPPKLIVIDSRLSETAKKATIHLAPKVGTNLALLNGIQYLLFDQGRINVEYVTKHVCGLDDLRNKVQHYPPEVVEKITGVPSKHLEEAAEIIGTSNSLLSTVLQGVYQSNQATASACQVNNINLLLGHIGKRGSGIYQMNGQPTAQNNREAGCDGEFPGFRNFNNKDHMQELADIWNIDLHKVPHWNQPTHVENMLKYITSGSIQMLWVSGTNPLVSLPNLPKSRDILTKPELFVIVQDIFMTETAAIADVVLPAAQWGEKTGCFTNVDRTVHLSLKAVDPPGEAKSDMAIFVDFAKRMDFKDKDGQPLIPWETSEEAFNAWKKLSKGRPCDYSSMTYEKLAGGSGIQWPCNEQNPYGKERLFEDGHFFTDVEYCESFGHDLETGTPISKTDYMALNPAGRAILKGCHYKPPLESPDDEFPLLLSNGRNVYHFHTRTKTGRSKPLMDACSEPYIEISASDAESYGVQENDELIVRSRRGSVQIKAKITGIPAGRVFIPFHFGYFDAKGGKARAANELTMEQWDPVSKQPFFKAGAVKIEKVSKDAEKNDGSKIHIPEPQTKMEKEIQDRKPDAHAVSDDSPRQRHLEFWLGEMNDSIRSLFEIYSRQIPRMVHDSEILSGLEVMNKITTETEDLLQPIFDKYGFKKRKGRVVSRQVRDTLFPDEDKSQTNSYEALESLLALNVYYSQVEGYLTALVPVSQALWDAKFVNSVTEAMNNLQRMTAWVKHQIIVRAPQTLVVPSKVVFEQVEKGHE